jgi:hypothetical protein
MLRPIVIGNALILRWVVTWSDGQVGEGVMRGDAGPT